MAEQVMNNLPLDILYDLLVQASRELMEAAEKDNRASAEIRAKRKQVAIILAAIDANIQKKTSTLDRIS